MKKYRVYYAEDPTAYENVKAEGHLDAIAIAAERMYVGTSGEIGRSFYVVYRERFYEVYVADSSAYGVSVWPTQLNSAAENRLRLIWNKSKREREERAAE